MARCLFPSRPPALADWLLRIVLAVTSLALAACGADRALSRDFARANLQLQSGQSQEAAQAYQQLLERHGPRPGLWRNLAEAQWQLDQPGPALLSLERACLLSPRGTAAWQRRDELRAELGLPADPTPRFVDEPWSWLQQALPRGHWALLAVLSAALLLILWLWAAIRPRTRLPWLRSGLLATLGALSVLIVHQRQPETRLGLVLQPAPRHLSPRPDAPEAGPALPAGQRVQLGELRGHWRWLSDEHGQPLGWLPEHQVAPIDAAAFPPTPTGKRVLPTQTEETITKSSSSSSVL